MRTARRLAVNLLLLAVFVACIVLLAGHWQQITH